MTPLLNQPFRTPYETAPFSKINAADFLPAFKQAIEAAALEIATIANQNTLPTFENTIEALEFSGMQLNRISSIFFNLNSAETNETIQKTAQDVAPQLTKFGNDIIFNRLLFDRVKTVYESHQPSNLTAEQQQLLEKTYKNFSRNGANLSNTDQETLRDIDTTLSQLQLTFGEHVLAETNAFEMHLTDESQLSGLPESAIEAAAQLAKSRNKSSWVFTLDAPSYIPFMTYADTRTLRKKMALAAGSKGFQNNDWDNQKQVLNIVKLRAQRAQLLGYQTHADFVLEERMAKTPIQVHNFLNDLLKKVKPIAMEEFKTLEEFAQKKDQLERIEKWDTAYYTEKLKQERFDLDTEQLKPYFSLDAVVAGMFGVANKLFDLHFEQINTIDTYHPDVKTYKVTDSSGALVAILYADFFPRTGKRGGAWMTSYKPQYIKNGTDSRPHVSIVCNVTKPTNTKPSLLTFNEVTTLFHEFGHALHGMLASTTYPSLSGTSVYWDFVELPSQLMENWCYEEEALASFAKHYQTGAIIPMDLIQKIKATLTFQQGMHTLRQLSFGLLDMGWHANPKPETITDVKAYEARIFEATRLYPSVKENCMSTAFSHIFQGGYASGYYSYKWAEVLDADAFEYFKEQGIFNADVAKKLKNQILSRGGTEDPMVLYKRFRGRAPQPEALLRRAGLLPTKKPDDVS